jgi:small-conductance mechanosensitive channel
VDAWSATRKNGHYRKLPHGIPFSMPPGPEMWSLGYYVPLLFNLARIALILILAYVCTLVVGRLLRGLRNYVIKMMLKAGGGTEYEIEKRVQTVSSVARKALFLVVWGIAWIMILTAMNFDIGPLLAGAGVIGVAVGFGAQSIVKDVLGGLFLLMENQIRVNDVAVINGKGGLVEEINLRHGAARRRRRGTHFPERVYPKPLEPDTRILVLFVQPLGGI